MYSEKIHTPWFLWPLRTMFELVEWTLRLTGRLLAAVLGMVIMIAGGVLTLTFIAAPIGLPMILFGFLLMIRGIF